MPDWSILLICFIAIALGWLLGRFQLFDVWMKFKNRAWHKSYMEGIHLLLNEEPDQAIEDFINSCEVNSESFELHNALASMLRRKGEVDRAIRIHANLVECSKLPKEQTHTSTIELANDYISAGLLDRAERLLINVVNNSKNFEERPLELLQQIYQIEKEWKKAILVAEQLLPKRSVTFEDKRLSSGKHHIEIAHYYCEIAEIALRDHNFKAAEEALSESLEVYPECARATLIRAELAVEKGNSESAITILEALPNQDPHLLINALPILERCFNNDSAAFVEYLRKMLDNYPSVQIEKAAFQALKEIDEFEAGEFLSQQVKKRPTLQGLELLVNEQLGLLQGVAKENLMLLHQLVSDVMKNKATHQCRECGFSGVQMHWLCPQCQCWDSIRRIRGSEGD